MKTIEERYQELKSAVQTIDENGISYTEEIYSKDDLIVVVTKTERESSVYFSYTSSVHWTNEAAHISKNDWEETASFGYGSGGTMGTDNAKIAKAMEQIFSHARDTIKRLEGNEMVGYFVPTDLGYELSKNQQQFVKDAQDQGLDIRWRYSGRGMYGDKCPGVVVGNAGSFNTKADIKQDSMGLDVILYAEN